MVTIDSKLYLIQVVNNWLKLKINDKKIQIKKKQKTKNKAKNKRKMELNELLNMNIVTI